MPKVSIREPIHNDLQARYPNLNASEAIACALSELSSLRILLQKTIGAAYVQAHPLTVPGAVALSPPVDD